jgi:hypothetical protein
MEKSARRIEMSASAKKEAAMQKVKQQLVIVVPEVFRFVIELDKRKKMPYKRFLRPADLQDKNIPDLNFCLASFYEHMDKARLVYKLFRAKKGDNNEKAREIKGKDLKEFIGALTKAFLSLGFSPERCSKFTRLNKLVTEDFDKIEGADLTFENFESIRKALFGLLHDINKIVPDEEVEETIRWAHAVADMELAREAFERMPRPPSSRGGGRRRATRKRAGKRRATRRRRV